MKFKRNNSVILTYDNDGFVVKTTKYKSINAAKRESRKIQIENDGALGRGCISVYK